MVDDLVLILNNQLTQHGLAQHAEIKITQQAKDDKRKWFERGKGLNGLFNGGRVSFLDNKQQQTVLPDPDDDNAERM